MLLSVRKPHGFGQMGKLKFIMINERVKVALAVSSIGLYNNRIDMKRLRILGSLKSNF
jgi:hypothetical protein